MARKVMEIEINSETTPQDLELCVHAADRSSDSNLERIAANARAEKYRRSRQDSRDLFNAESRERVNAQKVQAALVERQIKAQEKWMAQQLEVAKDQAKTTKGAERAAKWSAVATIAIAILTAVLAVIAVIAFLSK